jgi:hypothetical protein
VLVGGQVLPKFYGDLPDCLKLVVTDGESPFLIPQPTNKNINTSTSVAWRVFFQSRNITHILLLKSKLRITVRVALLKPSTADRSGVTDTEDEFSSIHSLK